MLTVLIPTLNGTNTLRQVLPAYCRMAVPPGGWKLVIIDNGSTDGTEDLISTFKDRLPLTYVYEPLPGKNAALNRGLDYVEGDLVVFTDDDSVPAGDWLVTMRNVCDANPSYSILAGKVIPRWEEPPANWLLTKVPLGPTFTISDPNMPEGPTSPSNVFGPNMAVRRNVLDAGHRFNISIGPKGKSYPMGSETEFVQRLVRLGCRCWYSPNMVVEHLIGREHMRRSWVLQRAVRYGRGRHRLEHIQNPQTYRRVLGVPRFLIRQLLQHIGRLVHSTVFDREDVFWARWELNFCWGCIVEARTIGSETTLRETAADAGNTRGSQEPQEGASAGRRP